MNYTLVARQLTFNEQQPAVDITAKPASITAIIGRVGAGKTRLLQTLAGIRLPLAGDLHILGANPNPASERAWRASRKDIAYILPGSSLTSHLTVLNNLTLPMTYHGLASQDEAEALALDMLERLALSDHARELPSRLNEAERKKLLVGRALLLNPRIMFIEQAFTGFDALMREQLVTFYRELVRERKISLILATRDMAALAALSHDYEHIDKLYFMASNELLMFESLSDLMSSSNDEVVAYCRAS